MSMTQNISIEEVEEADGLVIVTHDAKLGGFIVKAEGNERISRQRLARVLIAYGQHALEEEAAKS